MPPRKKRKKNWLGRLLDSFDDRRPPVTEPHVVKLAAPEPPPRSFPEVDLEAQKATREAMQRSTEMERVFFGMGQQQMQRDPMMQQAIAQQQMPYSAQAAGWDRFGRQLNQYYGNLGKGPYYSGGGK